MPKKTQPKPKPATLLWFGARPDGLYTCHLRAGHHDFAKHGLAIRTKLLFYSAASDPTQDLPALDDIHARAHAAGYWVSIERLPDGTIHDYEQEEKEAIEDGLDGDGNEAEDWGAEALIDGFSFSFADPGGHSALRAATEGRCPNRSCRKRIGRRDDFCKHCGAKLNPRTHPCPDCGAKNALTTEDVRLHYRCDRCADVAEGRGRIALYSDESY